MKRIKMIVGQMAQGKTNELIRLGVEATQKGKNVCAFMFDICRDDVSRKYMAISLGMEIKDFDYLHKFSSEEIARVDDEAYSKFYYVGKKTLEKLANDYRSVFDLSICCGRADIILFDDMEWLIKDDKRNITNESFMIALERLGNIPSVKEQNIIVTIQAQTYEKVKDWIPSNVETIML